MGVVSAKVLKGLRTEPLGNRRSREYSKLSRSISYVGMLLELGRDFSVQFSSSQGSKLGGSLLASKSATMLSSKAATRALNLSGPTISGKGKRCEGLLCYWSNDERWPFCKLANISQIKSTLREKLDGASFQFSTLEVSICNILVPRTFVMWLLLMECFV